MATTSIHSIPLSSIKDSSVFLLFLTDLLSSFFLFEKLTHLLSLSVQTIPKIQQAKLKPLLLSHMLCFSQNQSPEPEHGAPSFLLPLLVHFSPRIRSYTESESEFIQRVIKEISRTKSNREQLFVAKHPVGIDIRAEAVELLLDMESNDVCMVGICGIGGIGKTTISKAIYNRIAHRFEGSCFLENVREMSKINGDIIQLQEKLLSKILRDRALKVHNVFEGINLIKKRLHSRKVLLILDDVEDSKEVENLLGECNWFASGSRVIITTRDKHVLTTLGRDTRIYEVTKLSQCEAGELFNRHAFQASKYGEDYLELAEQIICYANGLPLALTIIGSDLYGKNIHEWKSVLEKYKKHASSIPNTFFNDDTNTSLYPPSKKTNTC